MSSRSPEVEANYRKYQETLDDQCDFCALISQATTQVVESLDGFLLHTHLIKLA